MTPVQDVGRGTLAQHALCVLILVKASPVRHDAERLSAGEQGLVRQAATLMITGDRISARAANGDSVDADALIRSTRA